MLLVEGASWGRAQREELRTALHRLKAKGLLASKWGKTETGRRAKFYELTTAGQEALEAQSRTWDAYVSAVARVMDAEEAAS